MLFYFCLSAFAEEPVFTPNLHVAMRPQVWTNPDYDSNTEDGIWSMKQLVRVGFTAETTGLKLHTRIQDYRMWGQEASPFANTDVLQTMYEGYAQIVFTPASWIRLGRQEFRLNDGRLLWNAPWAMYGKTYDAARFYSEGKKWEYNLMGGVFRSAQNYQTICDETVTDCTDFESEIIKSQGDLFMLTDLDFKPSEKIKINPYFLAIYQDASADDLNQNRQIYSLGAHAKGESNKNLFYSFEGTYQFGQESDDIEHSAWMAVGELGYKKEGKKISVFYEELSGDGDATDNVQNDFEGFQGGKHLHRGFADVIGTKNIRSYGLKTKANLNDKAAFFANVHHFELSNPEGYWYAFSNEAVGGGEAGNTDSVLGNEIDIRFDYKPNKAMNIQLTEGIFVPSGYGSEITAGDLSMTTYLWMRYTL